MGSRESRAAGPGWGPGSLGGWDGSPGVRKVGTGTWCQAKVVSGTPARAAPDPVSGRVPNEESRLGFGWAGQGRGAREGGVGRARATYRSVCGSPRPRRPAPLALTWRPAVGAARVAGVRRVQQLQQPLLVALAVAHGRPAGLHGLSGAVRAAATQAAPPPRPFRPASAQARRRVPAVRCARFAAGSASLGLSFHRRQRGDGFMPLSQGPWGKLNNLTSDQALY